MGSYLLDRGELYKVILSEDTVNILIFECAKQLQEQLLLTITLDGSVKFKFNRTQDEHRSLARVYELLDTTKELIQRWSNWYSKFKLLGSSIDNKIKINTNIAVMEELERNATVVLNGSGVFQYLGYGYICVKGKHLTDTGFIFVKYDFITQLDDGIIALDFSDIIDADKKIPKELFIIRKDLCLTEDCHMLVANGSRQYSYEVWNKYGCLPELAIFEPAVLEWEMI